MTEHCSYQSNGKNSAKWEFEHIFRIITTIQEDMMMKNLRLKCIIYLWECRKLIELDMVVPNTTQRE